MNYLRYALDAAIFALHPLRYAPALRSSHCVLNIAFVAPHYSPWVLLTLHTAFSPLRSSCCALLVALFSLRYFCCVPFATLFLAGLFPLRSFHCALFDTLFLLRSSRGVLLAALFSTRSACCALRVCLVESLPNIMQILDRAWHTFD